MVHRPDRHLLAPLACAAALALCGCQGFEDLPHADAERLTLELPRSTEAVFEAARHTALQSPELRVSAADPQARVLHLTVPINWWDFGQRVGVELHPTADGGTRVTITAIAALRHFPVTPHAAKRYARELERALAPPTS